MNVDFNMQTSVKSQTNFEKINSISSSISIMKRKTSSSSNIENEKKEEMKNSSKKKKKKKKEMKKKMIRISRIKQSKRASKNVRSKNVSSKVFRSKDCFALFDITFVDVVVYNLLSKQKNVKLFVIFLRNIDDQIQKNTDIFTNFKIIFFEKFHDLINVFFKIASDELTSHREHDHKIVIKKIRN